MDSETLDVGYILGGRFEVTDLEDCLPVLECGLAQDRETNKRVRVYRAPVKSGDVDTATLERRVVRAGSFVHKNVVPATAAGRVGDSVFLAHVVSDGRRLQEHLERRRSANRPFRRSDVLNLMGHVCNAVQYGREGLRHSLLCPANIFVLKSGRVQVAAFGFDTLRTTVQRQREALGEWDRGYFADGLPETDYDIAALGLLTLQLLTNRPWADGLAHALDDSGDALSPQMLAVLEGCLPGQGREVHVGPAVFKQALKAALGSIKETSDAPEPVRAGQISSAPPPVPRMINSELDSVEISGLHSIIEESFSVPPLAGPGVSSDGMANLQWLVEKDGVDYGPYTRQQVLDQLERDEITPAVIVCDLESDKRGTLAEFDSFQAELGGWAGRKGEREVAKKIESQQRATRIQRRITWGAVSAFLLTIAIGGAAWAYYQSTLPEPIKAHLPVMITPMEWGLPSIAPMEKESEEEKKAIAQAKRRKRAKSKGGGLGSERAQMRREARLAEVSSLQMAAGNGAEFSRVAFDRVISRRVRRIYRCLQSEVGRRPSVKAIQVSLAVLPTGRIINAKMLGGTDAGILCIRRALKSARVPAFDGTNVKITLPYRFE